MDPLRETPSTSLLVSFGRGWKTMLLVYLGVTIIAGTLAAPTAAMLIQAAVSLSGEPALSDTDIAAHLFSPLGALAGLILGTLALTLQLLGYAALLIPARSVCKHGHCHVACVLPLLVPALPRILRISLRFVVRLLLFSIPFALALAGIYFGLLGKHDINFYLAEKPPAFLWAAALAAVVLLGNLLMFSWLAGGWVHALPLAIFRKSSPGEALRLSRKAAAGNKWVIFRGIAAWAVLTPLAVSLVNLPFSAAAMWAARHLHEDLGWLVLVLGLCFGLSATAGWLIAFGGLSLLALQNIRLYQHSISDPDDEEKIQARPAPLISPAVMFAGGLSVCAVAACLSNRWIERLHDDHPAVIIAHRGASKDAPENTLAAVHAAIDAKADWIEIDVQESADGTVMVFHDSDFKRFRGPGKSIWQMRDAEIATIDIGSWKSPAFSSERTPRLTDVLSLCKDRAGVLIELKYYGHDQNLEARVVELVEAADMAGQVMIMSLNPRGIQKIRELRPHWKCGLLSSVALGDITRLKLDFLGLNARTTSRKLVRQAGKRGVQVFVWTVNDPIDMAAMLGRGVDGLITDDPALAREVLHERKEANFGEKLLMDLAAVLNRKPVTPRQ